MLGEEHVEVDVLEHQLREAALDHQIRDDLARIGEEQVGAVGAEQRPEILLGEALGCEDAGLLHLDQEGGLVLDLDRHRDREHHLINGGVELVDLGVEVELVTRLPLAPEDLGRVGRLEGDVLGVDALDGELTFVVLLFFGHAGT